MSDDEHGPRHTDITNTELADRDADDGEPDDEDGTAEDEPGGPVPRWVTNAAVLAVLWLFVRGVDLTPIRLLEEGLIGLAVGGVVAYGLRRFYGPTMPLARSLKTGPYAIAYLLAFLKEVVVANLAVARIVLSPSLPINPDVVEVPLRVQSDVAVTSIANSITLTPGTLTMDYDSETNTLYVHALDVTDRETVLAPIRTWEDFALVVFDEELDPGDPVPRYRGRDPAPDGGEGDG